MSKMTIEGDYSFMEGAGHVNQLVKLPDYFARLVGQQPISSETGVDDYNPIRAFLGDVPSGVIIRLRVEIEVYNES